MEVRLSPRVSAVALRSRLHRGWALLACLWLLTPWQAQAQDAIPPQAGPQSGDGDDAQAEVDPEDREPDYGDKPADLGEDGGDPALPDPLDQPLEDVHKETLKEVERQRAWGVDEDGHRTYLAGEAVDTEVLGERVQLPKRDRGKLLALSLGMSAYAPTLGGNTLLPFVALYGLYRNQTHHLRVLASGVFNEVDYDRSFDGPLLAVHLQNYTVPVASEEVSRGRQVRASSLYWGDGSAWLGGGYRWRLPPYAIDNDLRVGLYYRAGFEYYKKSSDTPDGLVLPLDTLEHGIQLRVRADSLLRNLMELPHLGWAAGVDVSVLRRDRWRDFGNPISGTTVDSEDTRDFLKVSAYVVAALPLPGLSERHRLLARAYGGWAPNGSLDRFSAFRVGGGPIPTESYDLARVPLPGALFDQFPLERYVLADLEYRFELAFFSFVHGRASFVRARSATRDQRGRYSDLEGVTLSAGFTTGFVWESQLFFEATQDLNGVTRGGDSGGTTFLLQWSKSF